jgi:hypothetical protein
MPAGLGIAGTGGRYGEGVRTARALGQVCCSVWAFLWQALAGIWCGLRNAVTWPQRKAAALPVEEWARLRAGEPMPRRGLGEDGAAEFTPPCAHRDAVPVDLLMTGERVAWWCEKCQTQLPADFSPAPKAAVILRSGGGGGGSTVAVYSQELAAAVRYQGSRPPASRRHWHAGPAGCASCAGSDASGSRWCLCGRCIAAAAASVMGPAG